MKRTKGSSCLAPLLVIFQLIVCFLAVNNFEKVFPSYAVNSCLKCHPNMFEVFIEFKKVESRHSGALSPEEVAILFQNYSPTKDIHKSLEIEDIKKAARNSYDIVITVFIVGILLPLALALISLNNSRK